MNHIVNSFNGSSKMSKHISDQVIYYTQDFEGPLLFEDGENGMEVAFSKPSAIAVESVHSVSRHDQNSEYAYQTNNIWENKAQHGKRATSRSKEANSLLLQAFFSNNEGYRFKCHQDDKANLTVLYISGAHYCAFQNKFLESVHGICQTDRVLLEGSEALFAQLEQEINEALQKDSTFDFCEGFESFDFNVDSSNTAFYEQHVHSIDYQLQIMAAFEPFSVDWMGALQIICDLASDTTLLPLLQSRQAVFALANVLTIFLTDVNSAAQVSGAEWRHILCCTLLALSRMSVHTTSLMDMLNCEPTVRVLVNLAANHSHELDGSVDLASQLVQEHVQQCCNTILSALSQLLQHSPPLLANYRSVAQVIAERAHSSTQSPSPAHPSTDGRTRAHSNPLMSNTAPLLSLVHEHELNGEWKTKLSLHNVQNMTGLTN